MQSKMISYKILFVLAAFLVVIQTDEADDEDTAIVLECAKASVSKKEVEKDGKKLELTPQQLLCFMKCTSEKKGFISEGKVVIEEAIKDPEVTADIDKDKMESWKECLNKIEVKECGDMTKILACDEAHKKT